MGDGETYERAAIEKHIAMRQKMLEQAQEELEETNGESRRAQRILANGITSPMGHGTLASTGLAPVMVPVLALRRLADDWRAENGV